MAIAAACFFLTFRSLSSSFSHPCSDVNMRLFLLLSQPFGNSAAVLLFVEEGILVLLFCCWCCSLTHAHTRPAKLFFFVSPSTVFVCYLQGLFVSSWCHLISFSQCVARRPACCPLQRVGALFCSFTFAFGDFTVPALFPHRSAGRVSLFSSFVVAPFFHCCSQNELCRVRTPSKCGGSASFPFQVPFLFFCFEGT